MMLTTMTSYFLQKTYTLLMRGYTIVRTTYFAMFHAVIEPEESPVKSLVLLMFDASAPTDGTLCGEWS